MIPQRFRPHWLPVVEEADDIWTAVGAVPSTHTTVVNLDVHAFSVVIGGKDRANRLTRRIFAVLAHDRNESRLDVREFAFPVSFDTDPRYRPVALIPVLRIKRDVVLNLTCKHAGLTARALVDVDSDRPLMISEPCLSDH